MADELYGSVKWKLLTLDIGIKHRENDFIGASRELGSLSVTGGHLVETEMHARCPVISSVWSQSPCLTKKHLVLYGAYGDYMTMDDRHVEGALVHRMRVGLRYAATDRLSFDAVIDHYAMWAGHHPTEVSYPVTIKNYIKVVTGRHAGEGGTMSDRLNVIGDHGGSEIFRVTYRARQMVCHGPARHTIQRRLGNGVLQFPRRSQYAVIQFH